MCQDFRGQPAAGKKGPAHRKQRRTPGPQSEIRSNSYFFLFAIFPIKITAIMMIKMAAEAEPGNIILMQASGTNVSGQVDSVIAGGLVISIVTQYL